MASFSGTINYYNIKKDPGRLDAFNKFFEFVRDYPVTNFNAISYSFDGFCFEFKGYINDNEYDEIEPLLKKVIKNE